MPGVIRKSTNGAIQVSPNFYLSEFVESDQAQRRGIDNTPDPISIKNIFATAALLEKVRTLLGNKPLIISSGYRCPILNAAVGGSVASDHLTGSAADFRVPGFGTPLQVAKAIADAKLPFGQLIWEGSWVHISIPTPQHKGGEVLTAKFRQNGTVTYAQGLQP